MCIWKANEAPNTGAGRRWCKYAILVVTSWAKLHAPHSRFDTKTSIIVHAKRLVFNVCGWAPVTRFVDSFAIRSAWSRKDDFGTRASEAGRL